MSASTSKYGLLTRHLHWLTVIAIIALFSLGWTMVPMELSEQKLKFYGWHKWLGLFVLLIVLLRLSTRLFTPAPAHNPSLPKLIVTMAKLGHISLYAALILLPLTGWLRSSTAGIEIKIFEIIPIPNLMAKNEILSGYLETTHWALGWFLVALIAGHIGAVFIHHMFFKDPIIKRMPPVKVYGSIAVGAICLGLITYVNYLPQMKSSEQSSSIKQTAKEEIKTTAKQNTGWQLIKKESSLKFTVTQKGAATEGEFKKYQLDLNFDPKMPQNAVVAINIDIKGMSFGNILADGALHSADWFDADKFPTAQFKAKGFKKTTEDTYQLIGQLKIKEITKNLSLPIKITINKDKNDPSNLKLKVEGQAKVLRLDYGLGSGEWERTDTLANEVLISINIAAQKTNDKSTE